jgi:hypothetical protein
MGQRFRFGKLGWGKQITEPSVWGVRISNQTQLKFLLILPSERIDVLPPQRRTAAARAPAASRMMPTRMRSGSLSPWIFLLRKFSLGFFICRLAVMCYTLIHCSRTPNISASPSRPAELNVWRASIVLITVGPTPRRELIRSKQGMQTPQCLKSYSAGPWSPVKIQ